MKLSQSGSGELQRTIMLPGLCDREYKTNTLRQKYCTDLSMMRRYARDPVSVLLRAFCSNTAFQQRDPHYFLSPHKAIS